MKTKSISVCIPCAYSHIKYLPDCLNSINDQSFSPNEVILVVSNIPNEDKEAYDKTVKNIKLLCDQYPNLNIKLDATPENKYAGENRNKAVSIATGDIISFIDADDLMRRDRLYIIHKIFILDPQVVGIIHKFYENKFPLPDHQEINFETSNVKEYLYSEELHFGHGTFLRTLFNEFQYSDKSRGQDIEFVHNILDKYIGRLRIYDQKLTYYISERSTFYSI